jgi:hypothetical protein
MSNVSERSYNETENRLFPRVIEAPSFDNFGVSQVTLKFFLALSALSSISLSTVKIGQNSTEELLKDILTYLKAKTVSIFGKLCVDLSTSEVTDLLDDFDGWTTPFKGTETQQQLISYLERKTCLLTLLHMCWESDGRLERTVQLTNVLKLRLMVYSIMFPLRRLSNLY